MTELTNFTDPTTDLTDREKTLLRVAGASEELIEMCETEIDSLERADGKPVDRNSVLEEVKKYIREWEDLDGDSAKGYTHVGGGFFSKIWDGELYAAYNHADRNNRAIMLEAFTTWEINNDRSTHQSPIKA